MSDEILWRESSRHFFNQRAAQVFEVSSSLESLCYVSGRDSRLWSNPHLYEDLLTDILSRLSAGADSQVLEVGCASGFLACGLAPRVSTYTGVDVAEETVRAGRKLGLTNAEFKVADGSRLPFANSIFDAALCYDVFTNFPDFDIGQSIICEMLRVVVPGGKVLIGSIPNLDTKSEYEQCVFNVSDELNEKYGPAKVNDLPAKYDGFLTRILQKVRPIEPKITCYYFTREQFQSLADSLGVHVDFYDIHPMNPYHGFRFNVVFTQAA